MFQRLKGFTIIELIVVIGIIAILAAIVIIAVNPGRQFALSRNAARKSDVLSILDAVHQQAAESNGVLSSAITTTPQNICNEDTGVTCAAGTVDLRAVLVPNYLSDIPVDPSTGTDANTQYSIVRDANNRVTVEAEAAELDQSISITR